MTDRTRTPRRRTRLLVLLIALVLTLAVGAGGFVWWKTSPPAFVAPAPVYIEAREAVQPEGEDAWPRYVELFRSELGIEHWKERPDRQASGAMSEENLRAVQRVIWEDWGEGDVASAHKALEQWESLLVAVRRVADTPACREPLVAFTSGAATQPAPVDHGDPPLDSRTTTFSPRLPFLVSRFQSTLLLDARAAIERGDEPAALRALEDQFRLAEHVGFSPLPIAVSYRANVERGVYAFIARRALTRDLTVEQVDGLLTLINDPRRDMPIGDRIARTEKVEANLMARQWAAEAWQSLRDPGRWADVFLSPSPRAVAREGEKGLLALATLADGPPSRRTHGALGSNDASYNVVDAWLIPLRARDALMTRRAATRVILLLARHHALTGEWPDALDDALAREDTREPWTGVPFVYARTPDGPAPFTLAAPPEATFLRKDERAITDPRGHAGEE